MTDDSIRLTGGHRGKVPKAGPICPMCFELGVHPTAQHCIEALRVERDRLVQIATRRRLNPSVEETGKYQPSYWP